MNEATIGRRIQQLRRDKGLTQDEVAEKLGVSPQAVSKWENDISYPDISLLIPLASLLDITVDELLSKEEEKKPALKILPPEERKNIDEMLLKIIVNSNDGDRVRVNLPVPLIKVGIEIGLQMPQLSGNKALQDVDIELILQMIEKGAIGKLVEVQSAEGDIVEIVVE